MGLKSLLQSGGMTMYVLVFISILSLTIIIERWVYYYRISMVKREIFMKNIAHELKKGNLAQALKISRSVDAPIARVVAAGLNAPGSKPEAIENAMEREIAIETVQLERFTNVEGTIGSTAVYIGLFGTVIGIIRAFRDIAQSSSGGINVVVNGISEALVCTAAGLCVAVPAVIAYNLFVKKIERFVTDMELCASETQDLLRAHHS
jgi:biopolymer transport protein ExbB/TolQ